MLPLVDRLAARQRFVEVVGQIPKTWLVTLFTLLLFGLLGWTYSQTTPLLEKDDEPSHFEVVAYIASQRRLPAMPEQFRAGVAPTVSAAMPHYFVPPLYGYLPFSCVDIR